MAGNKTEEKRINIIEVEQTKAKHTHLNNQQNGYRKPTKKNSQTLSLVAYRTKRVIHHIIKVVKTCLKKKENTGKQNPLQPHPHKQKKTTTRHAV